MHGSFCFFGIFEALRMTDKYFWNNARRLQCVFRRIYRGLDRVFLSANLSIGNIKKAVLFQSIHKEIFVTELIISQKADNCNYFYSLVLF